MSRPHTLFIVGAGASKDYGLPVGPELQSAIAKFVRPEHQTETGLHRVIEAALTEICGLGAKLSDVVEQCKWMAEALPLAPSIDTFLAQQSNPNDALSLIGKISIAYEIHEKEFRSSLSTFGKPIDFSEVAKTWLGKLWKLNNQGGISKAVDNPLPQISFLTFNYDRCIEQFLLAAIEKFYRFPIYRSAESLQNVRIDHVYGSLGEISLDNAAYPIRRKISTSEYVEVAKKIRTFSEQIEGHSIDRISKLIYSSNRIVFLGFSFGKINLDLLRTAVKNIGLQQSKQVYATCYGMSRFDRDFARNWAMRTFQTGTNGVQFADVTASEFFDEFSLMFS